MNEAVSKIVNRLFEAVPNPNEETEAIREELLNNCQEHFEDLIRRNYTEEEAEKEIAESLAGMEEVIAQAAAPAMPGPAEEDEVSGNVSPAAFCEPSDPEESPESSTGETESDSGKISLSVGDVQTLKIETVAEDLQFEHSPDGMIHVLWDPACEITVLTARLDKILRISVRKGLKLNREPEFSEKDFFSFSDEDGRFSINFQNLGNFIKSSILNVSRSLMSARLRIQLPEGFLPRLEASTRSGDVNLQNIPVRSAAVHSTSGDLEIITGSELREADLSTTSGDIRCCCTSDKVKLSSISGDLYFEGHTRSLEARSTSGDVNLSGCADEIRSSAISGDLEVSLRDDRTAFVSLHTTSGDINLQLPESFRARYTLSSRSGDIRNSRVNEESSLAAVEIRTISGDISIH